MSIYDAPVYDDCRRWIQNKYERGFSWDEIKLACMKDIPSLAAFLHRKIVEDDWPEISIDQWFELTDEQKEYESKQQDFRFRGSEGALFDTNQDNG